MSDEPYDVGRITYDRMGNPMVKGGLVERGSVLPVEDDGSITIFEYGEPGEAWYQRWWVPEKP